MKKNIFMFDVESNGLYGEGFAVGAIVSDNKGNVLDTFELKSVEGEKNIDNDWVKENVLQYLSDMPTVQTTKELRTEFYNFYMKHKENSRIFSDCNYPVETTFLADVAKDDLENRQWNMPYPLEDVATAENININRTKYYENNFFKENPTAINSVSQYKLRKHNPLDDSIASLYFFISKLGRKCL
jgi:hypothetical protein